MSNIKITYFHAKGRAEASRLALAIGGINFEDERIKGEEFGKRKAAGDLLFGSLPMMTVDGKQYAQSDAMLRYCGSIAGLYPKDPIDALKVDMVVGGLEDATIAIFKDSSKEARTKFVEEGIDRYFAPIEKLYSETKTTGPYLLGDKMTIADLKLYVSSETLKAGFINHVPTDVLQKFDHLMACAKAVGENEKVVEWNAKH